MKAINDLIAEMELDDEQAKNRESQIQDFYNKKKIIKIMAVTRTGTSGDIVLTERRILDRTITHFKELGRIVTLPRDFKMEMDCFGLCSIRCMKFKDNCRKCIRDFYEVK